MGCSTCKKKKHDNIISEHQEYNDNYRIKFYWVLGVWLVLGIYGIISLIFDIFTLL